MAHIIAGSRWIVQNVLSEAERRILPSLAPFAKSPTRVVAVVSLLARCYGGLFALVGLSEAVHIVSVSRGEEGGSLRGRGRRGNGGGEREENGRGGEGMGEDGG